MQKTGERFDEDEMETMMRLLHHKKVEEGLESARRDLLGRPFDEWYGNLENSCDVLSGSSASALAVGMVETLSVRDALILSMVAGHEDEGSMMLEYALHPQDPCNVSYLYHLLDNAFNDSTTRPECEWCLSGVNMLASMSGMFPERFRVQPLAVASYILWWLNRDNALGFAYDALAIDDQCTLARIVAVAEAKQLHPAWCEHALI